MVSKVERAMTERQRYWLGHVRAADASDESTVAYAGKQGLKVKDLYQWKTQLIKLGFYDADHPSSRFVAVKTRAPIVLGSSSVSSQCALVFPSGLRFEFQGDVAPGVIREVMLSASGHG